MSKTYRNPQAALVAAQRKLGGSLATYDGTPVLALTKLNEYGQPVTNYASVEAACIAAGVNYDPRNYDTFNPDQLDQDQTEADALARWLGIS